MIFPMNIVVCDKNKYTSIDTKTCESINSQEESTLCPGRKTKNIFSGVNKKYI